MQNGLLINPTICWRYAAWIGDLLARGCVQHTSDSPARTIHSTWVPAHTSGSSEADRASEQSSECRADKHLTAAHKQRCVFISQ